MWIDKYFKELPDQETVEKDLKDYLAYCRKTGQEPEARNLSEVNDDNVSCIRWTVKKYVRGEDV
jgi:hypothetical protein